MKDENYVVKHNFLIEQKHSRFTVMEEKILRTIISMITPNDKDFQEYEISVDDFRRLTKTSGGRIYEYIKDTVERLMDKKIEIKEPTPEGKTRWIWTRYISSADYVDGAGVMKICFDPKLKPYLLELKEQFTKYQLKYVMSLKSGYALRIYELLKQYQTIGKRCIDIIELRAYLGIKDGEYSRMYDFDKYVLALAKGEINKKTDLEIDYTKIKQGRSVKAVEFRITHKKLYDESQVAVDTYSTPERDRELMELCGLKGENFSSKQIWELYEIATGMMPGAVGEEIYEYIKLNYENMLMKDGIENRYAWLKKAAAEDYVNAKFWIARMKK